MLHQRHVWDHVSKLGSTASIEKAGNAVQSAPALSRRHFIQAAAGMSLTAAVGLQGTAEAMQNPSTSLVSNNSSPAPVPIPGGFNARVALGPRFPDRLFHFFLPQPGLEPS